mgnify:FL=1
MTEDDVERFILVRQRECVGVLEPDIVLYALRLSLCSRLHEDVFSGCGMLDAEDVGDMRSETAGDGAGSAAVASGDECSAAVFETGRQEKDEPDIEELVGLAEEREQVCGRVGSGASAMRAEDGLVVPRRVEVLSVRVRCHGHVGRELYCTRLTRIARQSTATRAAGRLWLFRVEKKWRWGPSDSLRGGRNCTASQAL